MLSFLAPGYLLAALAAAAGLIAAHFIVRRQPRAMMLPTARFVPDAPVLTTGWARIPTDLATLILRVLCVLLAGLALAGPFLQRREGGVAKVILADRSRAVADSAAVSDSVAAIRNPGDVVLGYGSTAFEEMPAARAMAGADAEVARGSLSAGLVAATRAAARFRGVADSVELVIVSSFAAEQLDAATARVRLEWPGRARLVRVPAASPDSSRPPALVSGIADPLAVALAIAMPRTHADTRIVRGALTGADSSWASEQPGRVLVHWPIMGAPSGFVARSQDAAAAGLVVGGPAVIAQFQRRWQYVPALGARAVAWWIDGDVAAAEGSLGRGCVRSVAVPVSASGDFVLRPDFHAVLRELLQPCGGAPGFDPMPARESAMLAGAGALAPSSAFAAPQRARSPITTWLLIAALGCALLELVVRRGRSAGIGADERVVGGSAPTRKVA